MSHGACEFYTVLAGEAQVRDSAQEWRSCRVGDEFFQQPGHEHEIRTTSEPLLALVFRTAGGVVGRQGGFKREPTMRVFKSRL